MPEAFPSVAPFLKPLSSDAWWREGGREGGRERGQDVFSSPVRDKQFRREGWEGGREGGKEDLPSWPLSPLPQVYTCPSVVTAPVCMPPQDTATASRGMGWTCLSSPWRKTREGTGWEKAWEITEGEGEGGREGREGGAQVSFHFIYFLIVMPAVPPSFPPSLPSLPPYLHPLALAGHNSPPPR